MFFVFLFLLDTQTWISSWLWLRWTKQEDTCCLWSSSIWLENVLVSEWLL